MHSFLNKTIYAKNPTTGKLAPYILKDIKEIFIVEDSQGKELKVDGIHLDDSMNDQKESINNFDYSLIFKEASEKIIANRQNCLPILAGAFTVLDIVRDNLEFKYINTEVEVAFIDYLEDNNILKII
jgi:hypothetical protein